MSVVAPGTTAGPIAASAHARHPTGSRPRRLTLRFVALGYLLLLLLAPTAMLFYRSFEHGLSPVWKAISNHDAVHALVLSLELVAIAVPLNAIFGVLAALWIVRGRMRGRAVLGAVMDLPFSLSPVIVGLALLLVWGDQGWFGNTLQQNGFQVAFAVPGLALATCFVSLPFVAREVIPTLREIGSDAEEAAETLGATPWQTFWRVTLPAIRWALIYGVVLTTARALGEFGAVSVISGGFEGSTQSLPLYVQDRYDQYDLTGAFTAGLVLAVLAIATLLLMNLLTRRRKARA
jgi:sulfate transport system permease protein